MYNGIGLQTPRGSATSGHITKNLSYIKPDFFRKGLDANTGRHEAISHLASMQSKANDDILGHNSKRELEAKIFELQESMVEQGYTDLEIEEKVNELKSQLSKPDRQQVPASRKSHASTDSHEILMRKEVENQKLKNAFGITSNFVEGEAFDPEIQEQKKKERALGREERNRQFEEKRQAREQERKSIAHSDETRKDHGNDIGTRYGRDGRDERNSQSSRYRDVRDDRNTSEKARERDAYDDRRRSGESFRERHYDNDSGYDAKRGAARHYDRARERETDSKQYRQSDERGGGSYSKRRDSRSRSRSQSPPGRRGSQRRHDSSDEDKGDKECDREEGEERPSRRTGTKGGREVRRGRSRSSESR